jgi:hypothetical protein
MGFPFLEIAQPAASHAIGFHRIKKKSTVSEQRTETRPNPASTRKNRR